MLPIPIPALQDNYIWTLTSRDGSAAVVVDPGESAPIIQYLEQTGAKLVAILVTHYHWDHTNGVAELAANSGAAVFAPAHEQKPVAATTKVCSGGDTVSIPELDLNYEVLDIPGHTLGHIAFYGHNQLFCGDTLFAAGCGRVFEGTPEQMHASLNKLSALRGDTLVYCGHEYTKANLAFAHLVEPENQAVIDKQTSVDALLQQNKPTLPSTIADEHATNPFLRCHLPEVKASAEQQCGRTLESATDVFTVIRDWKNRCPL